MLKRSIYKLYLGAHLLKERNIKRALKVVGYNKIFLDLGCWNGKKTVILSKLIKAKKAIGIELVPDAVKLARSNKIKVYELDLNNEKWPLPNESVDCVHSNLLIEHLSNVDFFISETYRVLKRGGYTIITTNNLSSWHNIFCLLLGWTPFDLAPSSSLRWAIGNPFALHKNVGHQHGYTFTHKCIYTTKWLKEWYALYGFKFQKVLGAGYYPLPAVIGSIDKTHSAFVTLVFKK